MSTGFYLNRRFRISCGETSFFRSLFPHVCVCASLYWQFKRTSSHYVDFVVSGKNEYLQLFLGEAHSSLFLFCMKRKKQLRVFTLTPWHYRWRIFVVWEAVSFGVPNTTPKKEKNIKAKTNMNIEAASTAVTKPISLLFFDLGTDIFIIFVFLNSRKQNKKYRSGIVYIDIVFIYKVWWYGLKIGNCSGCEAKCYFSSHCKLEFKLHAAIEKETTVTE